MNQNDLFPIIHSLYEGGAAYRFDNLSQTLIFRDPLVMVSGLQSIKKMFRRLNGLLPLTKIIRLEAIEHNQHPCAWNLVVEYRRTTRSKPIALTSVLEVDMNGSTIIRLTEHWKNPIPARGDTSNFAFKVIRSTLGMLASR